MRAEGRGGRVMGTLLVCLLALGCEQPSSADGKGKGQPPSAQPDRQRLLAELASGPLPQPPAGLQPAYTRLRDSASDAELRELLRHESPAVRVYAFQALAEHHPDSSLFAELSGALDDLAVVQLGGSGQLEATVAELSLERVQRRLSGAERDAVARRVLASGSPARAASRIKREWTLGPELHEPLRELARGGDGEALRALSRYRDAADIPLLAAALREPTAEHALHAITLFPDERFSAPLQALQRQPGLDGDLLCQLYATALRLPAPAAAELLAAPFASDVAPANLPAHLTCQRWVLSPELIRQHPEAGFRLWEREGALSIGQVQALAELDPARARHLSVTMAPALGRGAPEAATWLLQQTAGEERAAALRGLRAALRRASKKELDNLGDIVRGLQWRELLPELFARLESSRPLPDANLATFQSEITRSLVWQLSRWQLSEAERLRLVSWVMGGRAARERDTKDPIGQRIVEEYLVEVLNRAGLLQPS